MASSVDVTQVMGGPPSLAALLRARRYPVLSSQIPRADELVRRVDGVGERRNVRDERNDQKMPGDRKNRYKTWGAGMVNPLVTSSSPPTLLSPRRHPEGSLPVPWQLPGPTKHVGDPSSFPVVGCLRLRISNSTVWKCGSNLTGRATSVSFLPLKIDTYVYSRSSILMARRIVSTEPVGVDPPVLYIARKGERARRTSKTLTSRELYFELAPKRS